MERNKNSLLPSSEEAAAVGLELDHEVGDPDVPLLLQVGQHTSTEEYLRLSDPAPGHRF